MRRGSLLFSLFTGTILLGAAVVATAAPGVQGANCATPGCPGTGLCGVPATPTCCDRKCDTTPGGFCTRREIEVDIIRARCGGSGTDCPVTGCNPVSGMNASVSGNHTITYNFTNIGPPNSCGQRDLIVCEKWVRCDGADGNIVCGRCTTVSVTEATPTSTPGTSLDCAVSISADYQYIVDVVDVTGNVPPAGGSCHTCTLGCNPSAGCKNCANNAIAGSCAIPIP